MSDLTGRQRRRLRALAHDLDPVVHVGKGGLTEEVVAQVDRALEAHELVKVRFLDGKPVRAEMGPELARRTGAREAGGVGHVAILFRPHPDPGKRRIRLDGGPDRDEEAFG